MSITFQNGYQILRAPSTASLVTNGLVMNLLTAPSVGTIWTDVSGNNNTGSLITTAGGTFYYTASYGGGMVATGSAGSNTLIATPYNLTSSFSVEMVLQPNALSYWSTLWANEVYNTSKGWWAYYNSNAALYAGSLSSITSYTTPTATSNTPVHLIFILSGSTFNMYKNGQLQPGSTYSAPIGGVSNNGLNFGSRHPNNGTANTPTDSLKGVYYQMRVYNRPLTQLEVLQNYDTIKTTYGV